MLWAGTEGADYPAFTVLYKIKEILQVCFMVQPYKIFLSFLLVCMRSLPLMQKSDEKQQINNILKIYKKCSKKNSSLPSKHRNKNIFKKLVLVCKRSLLEMQFISEYKCWTEWFEKNKNYHNQDETKGYI